VHESDTWLVEPEIQKSLLEELEISPYHILRCITYVLIAPCYRNQPTDKFSSNPFTVQPEDKHHDFWGPCFIVSMYALVLSVGRVSSVSWVYVMWILASLIQHLTCRIWYTESTLAMHLAITGYSILPFIPITLIVTFCNPSILGALIITYIAVAWSSWAAIKTHILLAASLPADNRRKYLLLTVPVVLAELYFSSLIPMIGWK
jgi:hypothetical protein